MEKREVVEKRERMSRLAAGLDELGLLGIWGADASLYGWWFPGLFQIFLPGIPAHRITEDPDTLAAELESACAGFPAYEQWWGEATDEEAILENARAYRDEVRDAIEAGRFEDGDYFLEDYAHMRTWRGEVEGVEYEAVGPEFAPAPLPDYATPEYLRERIRASILRRREGNTTPARRLSPLPKLGEGARVSTHYPYAMAPMALFPLSTWEEDGKYAVGRVKGGEYRLKLDAWGALKGQGPQMVKTFIALEAYRYESGDPWGVFMVTPEQILRECMGARATRGRKGYSPAEKRNATLHLESVLELEAAVTWKVKGTQYRVRGPLYQRRATLESHEDLFGWEPHALRLQANPDMAAGAPKGKKDLFAPLHKSLLGLNPENDKVALYLGTFILYMGRMQWQERGVGVCRFTARRLVSELSSCGALDVRRYLERREGKRIRESLEKALEKLQRVGFLLSWEGGEEEPADLPEGTLEDVEDVLAAFPEDLPAARGKRSAGREWLRRGGYTFWSPTAEGRKRLPKG